MSKLSKELTIGNLHPRENLFLTGVLASANAEFQIPADGLSSIAIDLRDTFSLTVQIQGTVDGTNWMVIPVRPYLGGAYVASIVGAAQGVWAANLTAPFKAIRVLCTAFTSGSAIATLIGSNAVMDDSKQGLVTPILGTVTAAAGAAATLTLAAPGVGLRHYLTYLRIVRFAAAALTAAATPVLVTTTNIPGSLVFSFPAEAAAQGSIFSYQEDFGYPLMTNTQNAATTIVCPITTGVIWRVTAGYYVAP